MRWAAGLLAALPCLAHVVSMSTGEARLNGARLDYELRMPLYEAAHLRSPEAQPPEAQLFDAVRFRGAGGEARLLEHRCHEEGGNLVCSGLYLFEREVDQFDVECRLASITVPNHVHLLRAEHGDKRDQAAFDASFTTATIRFRPPTAIETAVRDGAAGFWRGVAGIAQILFLAALVLAARSKRELAVLAGMFLAGQTVAVAAHLSARLAASPKFIEAATALTIAYLAVEILFLPAAGQRWLVVGVLGLLHGAYFDLLLEAGDYGRTAFTGGAFAAELAMTAALGFTAGAAKMVLGPRGGLAGRICTALLLAASLIWFGAAVLT
ncbi:MAG: HupE/UreJ family protein [Acidobacteria bacterium]|nr:HupE/UreJ family protein [Acidobacteriota bacterium]